MANRKNVKKAYGVAKKAYNAYKKENGGKSSYTPIIITLLVIVILAAIAFGVYYFVFKKDSSNTPPPPGNGGLTDGTLKVTYIDVGQGDSAYIEFPDGKNMIIDGGDRDSETKTAVTTFFTENNITSLNYVLLTHTDSDHCGSLDDIVNQVESVEKAYIPKIKSNDYDFGLSSEYKTKDTNVYNDFIKAVSESTYISNGQTLSTELIFTVDEIVIEGEGYTFTMYCQSDEYYTAMNTSNAHDLNDVSPICVLEFNGKKLMFTGDANSSSEHSHTYGSSEKNFLNIMNEKGITDNNFNVDVLKVAHHGSEGASGEDFLGFIDAKYAVVSVGGTENTEAPFNAFIDTGFYGKNINYQAYENTKYGHPSASVCSTNGRLHTSGVQALFYTWYNKNIVCTIDAQGQILFSAEFEATSTDETTITFVEVAPPQLTCNIEVIAHRKEF